jgi:hypothetical protein
MNSTERELTLQELLQVLDKYLSLNSLDGKVDRQPLRIQLKELKDKLKKSA